jgi:hypothetical protein
MSRSIRSRLAKLEQYGGGGAFPVWCEDEADMAETVRAMIAAGEIDPGNVARCVFWANARAVVGSHEAALKSLAS